MCIAFYKQQHNDIVFILMLQLQKQLDLEINWTDVTKKV